MNKRKGNRFSSTKTASSSEMSDTALNDDYMSEAFLKVTEMREKSKAEECPRIISKKEASELMQNHLEEGLLTPLGEDNKGFMLLHKFGYTGETGLGRSGQGIPEPLLVPLKNQSSRMGLGGEDIRQKKREESKKRRELLEEETESYKQARCLAEEKLTDSFLNSTKENVINRQLMRDCGKAERAIYELDVKAQIAQHALWPAGYDEEATEEGGDVSDGSEGGEEDPRPRLQARLEYLRSVHRYCLYCGCVFESAAELYDCCPGLWDEDH